MDFRINASAIEEFRGRLLRLAEHPHLARWFWSRGLTPPEVELVRDVLGYVAADLKHELEVARQDEIIARQSALKAVG